MGGCIYLYVDEEDREQATEILNNLDGVDLALSRKETANRFRLMGSRIGDIMAFWSAVGLTLLATSPSKKMG